MRTRHPNLWRLSVSAQGGALVLLGIVSAHATPLDAEACAKLKSERDALAATGAGDMLRQRPSERRADITPDRSKQLRTLINLNGQLRFRCGMDLLLPTLKPDPVEEFVDAGDTPAPKPPQKQAVAKKPKATKADGVDAPTGTPVAPAPKTASTKATPAGEPPTDAAAKATPKSKAKTDDAYRAPQSGDPNATPLNKQVPKQP